jgi:branched-chain amino acid transport system ATP-binding protein
MTVSDHLQLGAWTKRRSGDVIKYMEGIYGLFPILQKRNKQFAGTLSGGERQILAIARGLMSRPKLLILDEPTLGLAPVIKDQLAEIMKDLNGRGTTILLVEQDALMALSISNRGYVLETGKVVLEGVGKDLIHNPEVQRAYLGMDEAETVIGGTV